MLSSRVAAYLTLALAAGTSAACSVYDRSLVADGGEGEDLGNVDLGPGHDGGPRVDGGPTDVLLPPPRPTIADTDGGAGEITFAIRNVHLNQQTNWDSIGYDLDGRNTTVDNMNVDCSPPDPHAAFEFDGMMGIDNSFGHNIFPLVGVVFSTLESDAQTSETAGHGTILVRATGWNGMDDDPQVDVTIAQAVFGTTADGSAVDPRTGNLLSGGAAPPPAWGGHDTFFVRDDAFVGGSATHPLIHDGNAYVAHRQVVVALPAGTEILFIAGMRAVDVKFAAPALAVATISPDTMVATKVTVAGRWSVNEMLIAATRLGFCTGSSNYCLLNNALSQHADVVAAGNGTGAGSTCDAVSLGVTFDGVRATWGGLAPSPMVPDACAGMPTMTCM